MSAVLSQQQESSSKIYQDIGKFLEDRGLETTPLHESLARLFNEKSSMVTPALEAAGDDALLTRAHEQARFIGNTNLEHNKKLTREALERALYDSEGNKVDDKTYEKNIKQILGTVTTGHPVFSKPLEVAQAKTRLEAHLSDPEKNHDTETTKALEAELLETKKNYDFQKPTLISEREESYWAIKNAHSAAREVEEIAIEIGKENYPDSWHTLDYMPTSIATWIPFDWDGRKDVEWYDLMRERILLQKQMFEEQILPDFEELKATLQAEGCDISAVGNSIAEIKKTLELINPQFEFYQNYDESKMQEMVLDLIKTTEERITSPDILINSLNSIDGFEDLSDKAQRKIVHMRSRLKNHGIAYADPHYRINSNSVLSALSEEIENKPTITNKENKIGLDETRMADVNDLLASVEGKSSNLLTLAGTDQTIMKHMFFIRQVQDHLDSHSSNRYLVAETHNATTILATLYFAKMAGVDHNIDISPLFEDGEGIDDANKILETYMNNEFYQKYLKQRPMVATQHGYSDAGREGNGFATTTYTDHRKCENIRTVANQGLEDKIFVNFLTGGISMGRGMHPRSFKDGVEYMHSKFAIEWAKHVGQKIKMEQSFQGQDGYMLFGTPESALSIVAQSLDHVTKDHAENDAPKDDPLYKKYREKARNFFKVARQGHEKLFKSSKNALLIDLFKRMLPSTGSRSVERLASSDGNRKLPRAIQHNGSLQQEDFLSTVTSGLGTAIKQDPEFFKAMMQESKAFRQGIDMVYHAMDIIDPSVMKSYIKRYDPEYWNIKAQNALDENEERIFDNISQYMAEINIFEGLSSTYREMEKDFRAINKGRKELDRDDDPIKNPVHAAEVARKQFNGAIGHGARLNAMEELFKKAVQLPAFSNASGHDRDRVVKDILNLDFGAIDALKEDIFISRPPASNDNGIVAQINALKPSEFNGNTRYDHILRDIIDPMFEAKDTIIAVSDINFDRHCAVG